MLDWKPFFLAYLRSRSRLFVYLISLTSLLLLFQFLFASLGIYFSLLFPAMLLCNHLIFHLGYIGGDAGLSSGTSLW